MLKNIITHSSILDFEDYNNFKNELLSNDINFLDFELDEDNKNFKIEDVRKIIDFQNSKSSEKRFLITNRNIRNTVVQNALLKVLEEPTENTFLVFFVKNKAMLLPTFLSRCQIINIENNNSLLVNLNDKIEKGEERDIIIKKILNSKTIQNNKYIRFAKLERFLKIENWNNRGLVSEKQFEDYKNLL